MMALQSKLEQRLVQKLILTPTLQQAIRLLQLTRLELRELLSTELQVNPVLEDAITIEDAAEEEIPGEGELKEEDGLDLDIEAFFQDYLDTPEYKTSSTRGLEEAPPIENVSVHTQNLVDYLLWQIQLIDLPDSLFNPVNYLIASLSQDGYLLESMEQISSESGFPMAQLEEGLSVVQSLDPPGVGARDHKECLLLQTDDPVVRKVISEHWDDFIHQRNEVIQRELGLDDLAFEAVTETICQLELYPGRKYSSLQQVYVEPDVYVIRSGMDYTVLLNDDGMPRLRVNKKYMRLYKKANREKDEETSLYLRKKIQSALWLLKSVEQRHRTLYRVARSIVDHQKAFLDQGKEHLRPLTLKTIAEIIHVHESTVSRVVANKYMQTPRGLFPMRMFFLQGLPTSDGSNGVTVAKAKQIIQNIIAEEDPASPHSDAGVARIIQNRYHIRLARRTVAKYREELDIPSSKERKNTS